LDFAGLLVGGAIALTGVWFVWLAWQGSRGAISQPGVTRRRSPDGSGWAKACEAAAGPIGVGGGVAAAGGLAVMATGLDTVGWIVSIGAIAAVGIAAVAGVVVGARAARG
jgi:hypothetical protein